MPADETREPAPQAADIADAEASEDLADEDDFYEDTDDRRERNVRAIIAAIILVIVVILILLLLRTCATTSKRGTVGDRTIVPVPPTVRLENVVSVWVKPGANIGPVVSRAGIRPTSTRTMGEGLYFVFLPDGANAALAVSRLKTDTRVYDAGYVYDDLKVTPLQGSP